MAARPRTISDESLLEAARAVFVREGGQATTATVAREAGVSEGTLFKRFGTKEELFRQACCPQPWAPDLAARVGHGDVAHHLAEIIDELIVFHREVMPRMMLLVAHGAFDPREHWRDDPESCPLRSLEHLADYIAAEMALDRLGDGDPRLVAQMLLGSTRAFVFFEMIGAGARPSDTANDFARRTADLLMRGIAPASAPETPPHRGPHR